MFYANLLDGREARDYKRKSLDRLKQLLHMTRPGLRPEGYVFFKKNGANRSV
jgi:hypothetical protein